MEVLSDGIDIRVSISRNPAENDTSAYLAHSGAELHARSKKMRNQLLWSSKTVPKKLETFLLELKEHIPRRESICWEKTQPKCFL